MGKIKEYIVFHCLGQRLNYLGEKKRGKEFLDIDVVAPDEATDAAVVTVNDPICGRKTEKNV